MFLKSTKCFCFLVVVVVVELFCFKAAAKNAFACMETKCEIYVFVLHFDGTNERVLFIVTMFLFLSSVHFGYCC